jgi:hypothetical protein
MDCTCAELTGSGSVATEASRASFMMPIISGGNDAFEKSFISVSILSEEASSCSLATSERSAAIDWLARTFRSISVQIASLWSRVMQRFGYASPQQSQKQLYLASPSPRPETAFA